MVEMSIWRRNYRGKKRRARCDFMTRREFLKHAQSGDGGFYLHAKSSRIIQFIRPVSNTGDFVRIRDVISGQKFNAHVSSLLKLSPLELFTASTFEIPMPSYRRCENGESGADSSGATEPQELGDLYFLR